MIHDECWRTAHHPTEVLLFEDNPGDARLLIAELDGQSMIDIHLSVADRLSKGLQLIAGREFHAILLDLNLPDSHGIETFERVRAAVPEIPLIVYTGVQDGRVAKQVLRGGAQDYVIKGPAIGPLLARAVYFAMERQQERVELCRRAARLEQNQATLLRVIESSADVIMIVDNSGTVRLANGSAQSIYGRSSGELEGQHFVIVPDAAEIDIPRPDGTTRTAEVRAIEMEWEGASAFLVSLRDVTGRKQAQEQVEAEKSRLESCVRERTAELVAANSELEAFGHSVSHDLRAPLRHIKGFTQMLQEEISGKLDESAQSLIERVLRSVDDMQRLIDDLLEFSLLGQREVSTEIVAVGPLVRQVIEGLASDSQGRAVEWRVADLPCLDADPGLLRVVLVNLLSNALKFTRGRDPALIEVFPAGGSHAAPVIAVRDNGAGFPAEGAERLFGVLQRLHTQAEFEGTGIGLATVKRIIAKHGGRVSAEGELGRGATFFFSVGPAAGET